MQTINLRLNPTQTERILLFLSESSGMWFEICKLKNQNTSQGWFGSEIDCTVRHFFAPGEQTTQVMLGSEIISLERKGEGKYAEYRVSGSEEKPKEEYEIIGGVAVRVK